ncbi:MAG: hypothetical protein H6727_02475 [Myxococcales bacterium]|nr:hypothetical protein [Myxococcales bacterium]
MSAEAKQKKALQVLKKAPFSTSAFRALRAFAQGKASKARLERQLEQGLREDARAWWRWVVWGRWNLAHQRCGKALGVFVEAEKLRTDWRLCAAQARSWVCSGEERRGLEQWLLCLKKTPRQALPRVTMGAARLALKLRASKELASLVDGADKQLWTKEGLLQLAQELARSGYASLSLKIYEEVLRQKKTLRARDWKEASEVALHAGALKKAHQFLRQAKTYQGPSWWRWELLGLEERLARREGKLKELYAQRKKKWEKLRGRAAFRAVRSWMWLARIAEELGKEQEMLRWDRLTLKHRPRALRPRIRLLRYMQKRKDRAGILRQIDALIRSGNADAAHIAFYVQALLKRSGRPQLSRWHASWALLYRGLMCYHRQPAFWMHYSVQESFGPVCYKSSREDWSEYRQRRWDFWWQHEASDVQKKDYQRGRQLLLDSVKRFARDFRALRIFERWLVWLGEDQQALAVRRRMVSLSVGDADAFFTLERMFRGMGEQELWKQLVRAHLQDGRLTLEGLGELLWHLRHADNQRQESMRVSTWNEAQRLLWKLEGPASKSSSKSRRTKKGRLWASVPCVWLRRSIQTKTAALRRIGRTFSLREKAASLGGIRRFDALERAFWWSLSVFDSCGGRGGLRQLHRRAERLSWSKEALLEILRGYVQMNGVLGVRRLLTKATLSPEEWGALVHTLLKDEMSLEIRVLFAKRSLKMMKGPSLLKSLIRLCQEADGCPSLLGEIETLLKNSQYPLSLRARLLGAITRTLGSEGLRWRILSAWEGTLKQETKVRRWLLSHPWVFLERDDDLGGKLRELESRLRGLPEPPK